MYLYRGLLNTCFGLDLQSQSPSVQVHVLYTFHKLPFLIRLSVPLSSLLL